MENVMITPVWQALRVAWAQLMADERDEHGRDPMFRDFCRGASPGVLCRERHVPTPSMGKAIGKSQTYVGRMLRYWRFLCYHRGARAERRNER